MKARRGFVYKFNKYGVSVNSWHIWVFGEEQRKLISQRIVTIALEKSLLYSEGISSELCDVC